jgi:hypothetical protein
MWIIRKGYSGGGSGGGGSGGWAVVYIGATPPQDPVVGLLWVDVSSNQFVLRSYDGATWRIIQANLYWDKIDGGTL